jgi:Ser/Thr protein kinase RdoA (MazF antagonist)
MAPFEDELLESALNQWTLPKPVRVAPLESGFAGDVWKVEAGNERYVAKLAYDARDSFESGLRLAEIVEQHGLSSGAPLRSNTGELSVLVERPVGHQHPLALLRFVPGHPIELDSEAGARVYGETLGKIHSILLKNGHRPKNSASIFDYLTEPRSEVDQHQWMRPAIDATIAAVHAFESTHKVTYGPIYGDTLQLRLDDVTGQVGVIDWGASDWGPLLFDIAMAIQAIKRTDLQNPQSFIEAYLGTGPISRDELDGLPTYQALMWARTARFFAWRFAHNVNSGDSRSDGNAATLSEAKQHLERLLNTRFT